MAAFIIITIAVVMIVYAISILYKRKNDQKKLDSIISKSGLTFVQKFRSKKKMDFIGIDESNKKILLVHQHSLLDMFENRKSNSKSEFIDSVLDFNQILKSEIVLDGNTVSSKSTSRTVGGALLGGALMGGVGAIVGGLSGGSTNNNHVKTLSLRIVTNSIANPNFYIDFFDSKLNAGTGSTRTDSMHYKPLFNECQKFHDIISIIIDQEDKKTA